MKKPKNPGAASTKTSSIKGPANRAEEEPISPESNAKMDRKFKTSEEIPLKKKKKSIPPDSTSQRGKLPGSKK